VYCAGDSGGNGGDLVLQGLALSPPLKIQRGQRGRAGQFVPFVPSQKKRRGQPQPAPLLAAPTVPFVPLTKTNFTPTSRDAGAAYAAFKSDPFNLLTQKKSGLVNSMVNTSTRTKVRDNVSTHINWEGF
jgi:hypothetical protein